MSNEAVKHDVAAAKFRRQKVDAMIMTDGDGPELRILARLAREYAVSKGIDPRAFAESCNLGSRSY